MDYNRRRAYFIQHTVTNEAGEYIPCIAVEGKQGFYRTDWAWGKDFDIAQQIADEKNEKLGHGKQEAYFIVMTTMPSLSNLRFDSENIAAG